MPARRAERREGEWRRQGRRRRAGKTVRLRGACAALSFGRCRRRAAWCAGVALPKVWLRMVLERRGLGIALVEKD